MTLTEARKLADATPDPILNGSLRPHNVIEAIAKVMEGLPAIGRNSQASAQQGGYAYRGIEAITSEAQSLFGKYGVVFVPEVHECETRDLTLGGKPWTDTVLKVSYTIYGPGGVEDRITVGPLVAIGRDNSDKGANKAMSQAFKYALLQVLCIGDKKDDADGQTHEADARPAPPDPAAEEAMHELGELIKGIDDPSEREKLASHLRGRFGPSAQMTLEQIQEAFAVAAGWPESIESTNEGEPNAHP
jgi:hypothetical protein